MEGALRALDRHAVKNSDAKRLTRAILRLNRKIRRSVNDDVWRVFMSLEELVNARNGDLIEKAVTLGLARGRRYPHDTEAMMERIKFYRRPDGSTFGVYPGDYGNGKIVIDYGPHIERLATVGPVTQIADNVDVWHDETRLHAPT